MLKRVSAFPMLYDIYWCWQPCFSQGSAVVTLPSEETWYRHHWRLCVTCDQLKLGAFKILMISFREVLLNLWLVSWLSGKTECKQSCRDQFVNVPSQWETMLHVSHWLGACTNLSLKLSCTVTVTFHKIYCWLIGKLWYLQLSCVGDTIVYH